MKVYAIIVLYNPQPSKLYKIRDRIISQVDGLIYVDNSSFDSIEGMKLSKLEFKLTNCQNLGIAKAQNQGIKKAMCMGATHVLLLDQDSMPTQNMVQNLSKGFFQNGKIGIVGANIRNAYSGILLNYGIKISQWKIINTPLFQPYTNVSYLIASGSLMSVSSIKEVGLMREDFFIDNVDFEWCLRASSKGYLILQSKEAILDHELGNGTKDRILNHSPFREYYIVLNSLRMSSLEYIPLMFRLRKIATTLGRIVLNSRPSRYNYLKASFKAIKDYFNKAIKDYFKPQHNGNI